MGRSGKKRTHAQYARDDDPDTVTTNKFGVASTLAHLQAPEGIAVNAPDSIVSFANDNDGEWKTVERRSKKPCRSIDSADRHTHNQNKPRENNSNYPALSYSELHKLQASIKISDLQSLVLYCLADGSSPQWVSLKHHGHVKKAVVLMVPGLEKGMFDGNLVLPHPACDGDVNQPQLESSNGQAASTKEDSVANLACNSTGGMQAGFSGRNTSPDDYLPTPLVADKLPVTLRPLANIFTHVWPVKAPGDDKYYKVHSPLHAMLAAPTPKSKEEKNRKGPKPFRESKSWEDKRTPITAFLASDEELRENEYTLHPAYFLTEKERDREIERRRHTKETAEDDWKDTCVVKLEDGTAPGGEIPEGSMTAGRKVLAMDCEMCKTEGGNMDLTRISIVGWDGSVVMDELVKPDKPIIDYLTPYSGITPAKLDAVTTTLSDIQSSLLELLTPHTIIVGHSLNSDLAALKLTHPFIIDTSILYQHPRGPPLKSSLKWLAQKYLNREIQKGHGTRGHDSIEDAIACLDLVKMKCEKGVKWGTSEASGESIFKRLSRTPRTGTVTSGGSDSQRGAVVDHGNPERNFGAAASICIACTDDVGVVEAVKRTVHGDEDGKLIPGGGVDFTWARMRELEALRGWSNDHRSPSVNPDSAANSNHNGLCDDISPTALSSAVAQTAQHIASVYASLPPCTLFIVYSGTGDPCEMSRLQALQRQLKKEYATKKWDELSVRWTDVEEQALRRACAKAREGVGFVAIK